jgi:NAD(P)-dependent dehydrogenase (short-subunit alcohol dehydrogenase family)
LVVDTVAGLYSAGGTATYVHLDVTKEEEWKAAIDQTVTAHGGLNVLVNNAGISGSAAEDLYDTALWHRLMDINSTGVFLGMKYAIPLMLKTGGGSIINTSSMASLVAFPEMPAYCAAKGGVSMITKLTAAEYAAEGIRVNAILPGAIATGMTAALPADYLAGAVAGTPLGRIGTPEEIANLALFLASDESSFITGTLTPVDGGYTLF